MLRIILVSILFLLLSCSNKMKFTNPSSKINPYELYKTAYEAFEKNDFFFANKNFLKLS